MTDIATNLNTIDGSLSDIKTAIVNKGGTVSGNITTFATAIDNIPSGGANIPREVSATGVLQFPTQSFTFSLPSGTTDVGDYGLTRILSIGDHSPAGTYPHTTGSFVADLSTLTKVSGVYALSDAFNECTGMTGFNLSSLKEVSGNYAFQRAFQWCNSLTSINSSNNKIALNSVSGNSAFYYAFYQCTGLTYFSANFGNISGSNALQLICYGCTNLVECKLYWKTLSATNGLQYAFSGCTSMRWATLDCDVDITVGNALDGIFYNCTNLEDIEFYTYGTISNTNALSGMMRNTGSTTTHTIHFDSSMRSIIESLTGYPTFGGTSGYVTIAYDL